MNKAKLITPEAMALPPTEIVSYNQREFMGLWTTGTPDAIPPGASPSMTDIIIENGGIRRSYGYAAVGDTINAGNQIVGVGVHGYTSGAVATKRLIRLIKNGIELNVQQWNGVTWSNVAGVVNLRDNIRQSFCSIQGLLVVAGGSLGFWDFANPANFAKDDLYSAAQVFSFGDRLILVNVSDPQKLMWSRDGYPKDLTGVGSGTIILVDTFGDPVDELQCGVPIGHNTFALFRKVSIMKGFETGSSVQAIGVTRWIEGLGTSSPYSAVGTSMGVAFFGSDKMFYLLFPDGTTVQIGTPIWETTRQFNDVAYINGAYDPLRQQVWFSGFQQLSAQPAGYSLVFDLRKFRDEKKLAWYRAEFPAQHLAFVPDIFSNPAVGDMYFSYDNSTSTTVEKLDYTGNLRNGVSFNGVWQSHTLNKTEDRKQATLTLLELTYQATGDFQFLVYASGDGGYTWYSPLGDGTETHIFYAERTIGNEMKTISIPFNVTGYDVRFKIELRDSAWSMTLFGYRPRLVMRGGVEYTQQTVPRHFL